MALQQQIKILANGGIDTDSAIPFIDAHDYFTAINARIIGDKSGNAGYITNPESTQFVSGTRPAGINKGLGGRGFNEIQKIVFAIYNSAGYHQLGIYDMATMTQRIIFTDKTDSGGLQLLNWSPKHQLQFILINNTYLAWADGYSPVGFTNLNTLISGGYGVVQAEDLSLIKPQNLVPISAYYISDIGRGANYLKGKLPQFTSQYIGADYDYSTWATWSKRITPAQESTPTIGTNPSENNAIVVTVNIGSSRVETINIACRFGTFDYSIIKAVQRDYVTALPNSAIDVTNEVYEAYNAADNTYSFVFYNDSLNIQVPATDTDQFVDYIWIANAIEQLNGNIIALGDLKAGYDRPTTSVTVSAVGYNPNLTIPAANLTGRMSYTIVNPGQSGSGDGNHRRTIVLNFSPEPKNGDQIQIYMVDIRNASNVTTYSYTVPSSQENHLDQVMNSLASILPNASYQIQNDGTVNLTWVDQPYNTLRNVVISLYNTGATVSKSIAAILDNSSYQLALSYRDAFGRPFPLQTGNEFIVPTPSFAQLQGQTPQIAWKINSAAPAGAMDYQWLISQNGTVLENGNLLDVMGNLLAYKGGWSALNNSTGASQPLAAGTGTVGDTYQITTPNANTDTAHIVNLGNGAVQFNTGDYVVYNGTTWDILPKSFGDLTSTGNIMAVKINPLYLFNKLYSNQNINTILGYDYAAGDRATLHYYFDPATSANVNYFNNPAVDLTVFGFDASTYLLKIEKSSALDLTALAGKDIYFRLYTPNTQKETENTADTTTSQNATLFYEIGERYTITNGQHDVPSGSITNGDVYFRTRSYNGAVDPNNVYNVLATGFNFSDFYASAFSSYGRPRSYYDVLETTERIGVIYSQKYIQGSRYNGLTRFYQEDFYGEGDGQISSSFGPIMRMWMSGSTLHIFQANNVFYIPVNLSILQDMAEQKQYAISEKLLNPGRYYQGGAIGMGNSSTAFCVDYKRNVAYFIDPNKSEPFALTAGGIDSISHKNSKFFKNTLQLAYSLGLEPILYFDPYYDEVILAIPTLSGVLTFSPFNSDNWQTLDPYNPVPSDITNVAAPAHATVSYDQNTGLATYTPTQFFVGNTVSQFTFNASGNPVSKNVCLNWTQGSGNVNPFSFSPKSAQPLDTDVTSNMIMVIGNDYPVPISIIGGQYSINGNPFTNAAGTVNPGDSVQVLVHTSSSYSTPASCNLTVSNEGASFTATTIDNSGGGGGGNTQNLFINNNSNTVIGEVDYNGPSVGSTHGINPQGSQTIPIQPGTYSITVKVGGSSGYVVNINGSSYPISPGSNSTGGTGFTAPIYITVTNQGSVQN